MRIECWVVVVACNLDDLAVAAFDSEGEAHDYCTSLINLPQQAQTEIVDEAYAMSGLPDKSECIRFIRFVVRHVPKRR